MGTTTNRLLGLLDAMMKGVAANLLLERLEPAIDWKALEQALHGLSAGALRGLGAQALRAGVQECVLEPQAGSKHRRGMSQACPATAKGSKTPETICCEH